MKSSAKKVELASVDDLFSTEEGRQDAKLEKIQEISLSELHPFKNHPFKVKDDEAMMETADSVRQYGVLVPAIARPDPEGGYELIAGHRRHRASELAEKETMPVIVRDLDDDAATIDASIPADPSVKNYSYTVVDGAVYFRENSRMVRPDLNATAEARVKGLVGLRECVQQLIDLQMDAATSDSAIQDKQAELNRLYDSFSTKYGLINDRANRLAFADDSSYYLLCALEIVDEDGRLERKADMFTTRTIKPHEAVTSVDTASEALAVGAFRYTSRENRQEHLQRHIYFNDASLKL